MKRAFVILLATTLAASAQVQYAFTNLAGLPGGPGSVDGTAGAARFNYPSGVAVDSAGNVYVADSGNSTIRKITPDGAVTTLAGRAGQSGRADGTGSAARFNEPSGVAVDSAGNLYVAEFLNSTIRKITPTGVVTTLAFVIFNPFSVAVDCAGGVYVADTLDHTIGKVTPGGSVTTLAGSPGQIGNEDGIGTAARFGAGGVGPYFDHGPYGVAADCAGNVQVAE